MIIGKKVLTIFLLISTTLILYSFNLPTGWFKAGSEPESYEMGIDNGAGQDGKNAATIKSTAKKINGFGTLMQTSLPNNFIGKRIRMSGMLKAKDVSDWSGFWFRIDQAGSTQSLGFDNMKDGKNDRSIKGTTDWKRYEIVLDVPSKASNLAYGALLSGTGQIWFDDIQFEVVDESIPTTGMERESLTPRKEPINLDFEK